MGFWMVAVTGGFCRLRRRRVGQERRRRRLCRKKKRTNRLISISSPKSPPLGFFWLLPHGAQKSVLPCCGFGTVCATRKGRGCKGRGKPWGKAHARTRGKGFLKMRFLCAETHTKPRGEKLGQDSTPGLAGKRRWILGWAAPRTVQDDVHQAGIVQAALGSVGSSRSFAELQFPVPQPDASRGAAGFVAAAPQAEGKVLPARPVAFLQVERFSGEVDGDGDLIVLVNVGGDGGTWLSWREKKLESRKFTWER